MEESVSQQPGGDLTLGHTASTVFLLVVSLFAFAEL